MSREFNSRYNLRETFSLHLRRTLNASLASQLSNSNTLLARYLMNLHRLIRFSPLICTLVLAATSVIGGYAADEANPNPTPAQTAFFEKSIRPLLIEKCFACHSDKMQMGGLRLDSRAFLLKGNDHGSTVNLKQPELSPLIAVIHYDGKVKMPPAGKLKPIEMAALMEWVQMGAPWPVDKAAPAAGPAPMVITDAQRGFWSFKPIHKPVTPKVKNTAWVKSAIDSFILSKLEAKRLKPAPPADRRSLIRRAYFDLVGLPPTPDEVQAFLMDKSPSAFAKVVDHLLASPHYGERWGRHWLDVARYADSNGLDENLAFGNAFRYRDYVIDAMNKDKPYNQFIKEQLAGDLIPFANDAERNEHFIATGFLSMGPKVLAEQDKPKMVMDIVDEQIEVSSKAFLGLTIACARCHNHKFDPIPTKDYYALAGIFKSTKTMENLDFVSRVNERELMTSELKTQVDAHNARLKPLQAEVKTLTDKANAELIALEKRDFDKYLQAGWDLAHQPAIKSAAETKPKADDGRILIEAENFIRGTVVKNFDTYGKGIGVVNSAGANGYAEWDIPIPQAAAYQVELRYASAEQRPVRVLLNGKILLREAANQSTGSFNPDGQKWEAQGVFLLSNGKNTLRIEADGNFPHIDKILLIPYKSIGGPDGKIPLNPEQIAEAAGVNSIIALRAADIIKNAKDFAAAKAALSDPKTGLLVLPEKPAKYYPAAEQTQVSKADAAVKAEEAAAPKIPKALVVAEGDIQDVKVHIRGSTLTLGEVAPRTFLAVLGGDKLPPVDNKHSGRLEFAQWLTRPEHPLTSRVEVNRIWQTHFGLGIVRTPDNWGLLGDRPQQPELLDWLAATFIEDGWSLKKMHRRIMLSNAYQMSCDEDPKAMLADPDNRLIWRMNRLRLDAEPFRDSILTVAGQLDMKMGGSLMTSGDNDYVTNDQSGNAGQYTSPRRSVYLPVIRNALFDMFQAFDFGDPSAPHALRASTTVAPQALYVMNSPFILQESKSFAKLLESSATNETERIKQGYVRAFARPPSLIETKRALNYLNRYQAQLTSIEKDSKKQRQMAWESLCQILLASNEFIYLN